MVLSFDYIVVIFRSNLTTIYTNFTNTSISDPPGYGIAGDGLLKKKIRTCEKQVPVFIAVAVADSHPKQSESNAAGIAVTDIDAKKNLESRSLTRR